MMARTHFEVAAVLFLSLATLASYGQGKVLGNISRLEGEVNVVREHGAPVPLQKRDEVRSGDLIQSAADSSATLRLLDGSTIRIFPDSRVELRPEDGQWKEFLNLLLGNVRMQIEKLSGRPNPKVMTTPTAIIGVRGTLFAVAVEPNGDTRVGLEKGQVDVADRAHPDHHVLMKPGEEVFVRSREGLGQPHRMQGSMPGLANQGSSKAGMHGTGREAGTGRPPSAAGRRRP